MAINKPCSALPIINLAGHWMPLRLNGCQGWKGRSVDTRKGLRWFTLHPVLEGYLQVVDYPQQWQRAYGVPLRTAQDAGLTRC